MTEKPPVEIGTIAALVIIIGLTTFLFALLLT